ncbi:MAG: nucleotidyltransferase family protein [Betaproteobacteria bacterium]
MHSDDLKKFLVHEKGSLREAMQVINDNWREIALVTDDVNTIVGVVTDGDIRRGLLAGMTLEAAVNRVMTTDYVRVSPEMDRSGVLDLMKAASVRHVPVIDARQRLVAIHFLDVLLGTEVKPNVAVIMAGGEGRRLRPLTDRTPKPMIRVAGRPILERIVLLLVGYGIRHIYVAVNYMADAIVDHFGDGGRFGCRIEYLRETMAHGTGGALSLLPQPPSAPLIVMNGDLVTQIDIGRLLAFHAREGAAATLAARHYQTEIPYGVVAERAGRLRELVEKPTADYLINAGIYVLDPAVLSLVPHETFFPITDLFAKLLARQQPVAVYQVEEDWIDVGRRDELTRAERGEAS